MADPLPPPKNPKSLGPDAWWNPFSPSWPPTAAGRAAREVLGDKAQEAADKLLSAAETAAANVVPIDPVPPAIALLGAPTWGYWAPTALAGLGSLAVLAGGVYLVAEHKKRKKR